MKIAGSVVLVTGASSGIGQSTAVTLARQGVGVVLTYRNNPAGAQETVAQIEAVGGTVVALPLDVGRPDTFPTFVEELTRATPPGSDERQGQDGQRARQRRGGHDGGLGST